MFLKKILDYFKPLYFEDPVFGRLRFMKMRDPSKCYWEGAGKFRGVEAEIEYGVDGDQNGPGESQRRLYEKIQNRFPDLVAEIGPVLSKNYESWLDQPAPDDLGSAFQLSFLSIPRSESPDMEWDLTFECASDPDHIFVVYMKGWSPTGDVSIDG